MSGVAPSPFQVLLTAQEAYPALERCFLRAEQGIVAGFRIFDPMTKLRSAEARETGDTWADLIGHTLSRGVDITLNLADFDPVAASDLHRGCWRSVRILCGVREMAGGGRLTLHARRHPAAVNAVPRFLLWPAAMLKLQKLRRRLDRMDPALRVLALKELPGLRALARPITLYPASHHQKLAVIDRRFLYIGGLDLDERRFDEKTHRRAAQRTWHDVQVLIDDPGRAGAALRHLQTCYDMEPGRRVPDAVPGFLRTLSVRRPAREIWAMSPRTVVDEIARAHFAQIGAARRLIYLETQFFRSRALARLLAARARSTPDLSLILILPGAPEAVAFETDVSLAARYGEHLQARCLNIVRKAFGDRMLVASPVQPRPVTGQDFNGERAQLHGAPLVYVHAKVSVFDDTAAIVSSANLNGRSLCWDTEAGVLLTQPQETATVREQLFRHWLPDDAPQDAFHPATAFGHWARIVAQNARRVPDQRRGFLVPYDMSAAWRWGRAVPAVPEEMV